MASVKALKEFNKRIIKEVVSLGAKKWEGSTSSAQTRYCIETKAGTLNITIINDDFPSKIYSIYSCFQNPEKAKKTLSVWSAQRLNTYSGKWNVHLYTEESALRMFIDDLKEIL